MSHKHCPNTLLNFSVAWKFSQKGCQRTLLNIEIRSLHAMTLVASAIISKNSFTSHCTYFFNSWKAYFSKKYHCQTLASSLSSIPGNILIKDNTFCVFYFYNVVITIFLLFYDRCVSSTFFTIREASFTRSSLVAGHVGPTFKQS